ncbi:MAG TPA: serine protease, partial [Urbifossiella sp.]|nr:serine protease [Urbifossiella sp.]
MLSPRLSRPARAALALLVVAALAPAARPQPLPADQLKAVKDATVLLRVTLPNGDKVTGSGFFAQEPGLVVTNAHVLGMLDPDGRRPLKVEVVVRSGEPTSQTLPAAVLGVDRGTDLGVVRVEGKGLPAPLPLASADGLTETEEVYAFGFPFGDRLGKNITVAKTSVSSLRKTAGGLLEKVQVNGGIHPGNSGGPVTDAKGRVVGVAVSGVRNTQIHFAVPADRVTRYLIGRLTATHQELPYRAGAAVKREYRAELLDPLGRVQKVVVECFTAPDGPPRKTADAAPAPQPGDSPVKAFTLKYDPKTGLATGEIEVPPLPSPAHKLYARPVVTDGAGKTRWYGTTGEGPKYILDRVPVDLSYRPAGGTTPGEVVSIGAFRLRTPNDDELAMGLNLKARYAEKAAPADGKLFPARLTPTGFSASVTQDGKALPR